MYYIGYYLLFFPELRFETVMETAVHCAMTFATTFAHLLNYVSLVSYSANFDCKVVKPMLACRAISRPATTLRLKFQFPRRPIHYSIPRLQIPLRPNEIWKTIRFRKDGQPRSRIVGVAFGAFHLLFLFRWLTSKHEASVIALWAWTAYTLYNSIDEGETALNLLGAVIYIQKADTGFSKVDLNDPIATLKHFKALYQGLTRFPRA